MPFLMQDEGAERKSDTERVLRRGRDHEEAHLAEQEKHVRLERDAARGEARVHVPRAAGRQRRGEERPKGERGHAGPSTRRRPEPR